MRNINKTISKVENVTNTIDLIAVKESFSYIREDKKRRVIEIGVDFLNEDGYWIHEEHYIVDGNDYDLLMSESPSFAINKPKNEYREIDLWYIVDLMRSIE